MVSQRFDGMMKPIGMIWLWAVFIGLQQSLAQNNQTNQSVSVMSFNIHAGYGTDGTFDLLKIGNQIREAQPEIVCLQEVDYRTHRSQVKDVTLELANITDFHSFFGKAISFDGGEYGLAILSKYPILEVRVHSLPNDGVAEPRIALETIVEINGMGNIRIVNVHLDYSNKELNLSQIRYVNKKFTDGKPTIMAGDFNQIMESKGMQQLVRDWNLSMDARAFTYPANKPNTKIDYLMAYPRNEWEIKSARLLKDERASDHLPILATFSLIKF